MTLATQVKLCHMAMVLRGAEVTALDRLRRKPARNTAAMLTITQTNVVLDSRVDSAICRASWRSAFLSAHVATIAEVRAFWNHDGVNFNKVETMEVVSIGARADAARHTTFFSTPQFLPAAAFMSLVHIFARQRACSFAARCTA